VIPILNKLSHWPSASRFATVCAFSFKLIHALKWMTGCYLLCFIGFLKKNWKYFRGRVVCGLWMFHLHEFLVRSKLSLTEHEANKSHTPTLLTPRFHNRCGWRVRRATGVVGTNWEYFDKPHQAGHPGSHPRLVESHRYTFVSDIAIFVLKRDVKLQLTNIDVPLQWNGKQSKCALKTYMRGTKEITAIF